MSMNPLYNSYGFLNTSPAGATINNPLVSNPAGGSANPLMADPGGGTIPQNSGTSYNVNPGTQQGSGWFGRVPGAVALPNPEQDLSGVVPTLGQSNDVMQANIQAELEGGLSPGT